ncbi:MAG: Lrp/AsnC family transcriptional regulator [Pseudomonadota bacterium]
MKVRLDAVDWKILRALQADGRMTNVELARRAGISAPPCLRRVRALEQSNIITGYRALLDEKQLGFDLTAFAYVGLKNQSEAELVRFESQLRAWPIVREAWMVSGEVDFVLLCMADTLRSFQNFIIDTLTAAENVESVRTSLTIRQTKAEPRVPMESTDQEATPELGGVG